MRSKRCETCRHFERTGFEGDYYDGTCRIRSVPCTTFPSRKYNEWCGEWAFTDDTDSGPEEETYAVDRIYVDSEDRIAISEKVRLIQQSAPVIVQAPKWRGEWACDEAEAPPVPAAAGSTDT